MTKITLDLYDLLTEAFGAETTTIPATVDINDLLEFNGLDEHDLDLRDLLHGNRIIAQLWSVPDVQSLRPDLDDEQAWAVLVELEPDAIDGLGIDASDIKRVADQLFGPRRTVRIDRCDRVIAAYGDDLPDSNFIDLVTDAMHWCQAKGHDFERALELALTHFEAETVSEAETHHD